MCNCVNFELISFNLFQFIAEWRLVMFNSLSVILNECKFFRFMKMLILVISTTAFLCRQILQASLTLLSNFELCWHFLWTIIASVIRLWMAIMPFCWWVPFKNVLIGNYMMYQLDNHFSLSILGKKVFYY